MAKYEFFCPCSGAMKTDDYGFFSSFIKDHNAEHIEKVLELKSKTPKYFPLGLNHSYQVVETPCSCKTVVTG